MVDLRAAATDETWASKQLHEALKNGQSISYPHQCMKIYKFCPYTKRMMMALLRVFGNRWPWGYIYTPMEVGINIILATRLPNKISMPKYYTSSADFHYSMICHQIIFILFYIFSANKNRINRLLSLFRPNNCIFISNEPMEIQKQKISYLFRKNGLILKILLATLVATYQQGPA